MLNRIGQLFAARKAEGETAIDKAHACKQRGNVRLAKGQLDAAAECYREAVAIAPDYAEGFNNLGFVCLRQDRHDEAEQHLGRALALNPHLANAHFNLGVLHQKTGRGEAALASYTRAIDLAPLNVDALYNRGSLLLELGRNDEALDSLRRAISANPNHLQSHHDLGLALQRLGRLEEARDSFRHATALDPEFVVAHFNLALTLRQMGRSNEAMACLNRTIALAPDFVDAYYELGNLLRDQKQLDDAVLYYENVIALQPAHCRARLGLGLAFIMQDRFEDAVASFRAAVGFDPNFSAGHMSLAEALQKLGRLDEALSSAEKAIALAPEVAESHIVKSLALKDQGRLADATACLRHALRLNPKLEAAHFALSALLLAQGEFAEGWDLFGRRFYSDSPAYRRSFGAASWAGEDLHDKTILLWGDQGVGDEMLFANLFADVVARARRCIVECTPKLVPLFARSFPDVLVVPKSNPPHPATGDADVQIAAADTARWLRPDVASFPHHDGYLVPDPVRVTHWKSRLAQLGPGLKVGFGWRSKDRESSRSLQCTTLDQWGAIFAVPGVHFINLQYDGCEEELAAARREFDVALHAFEEVDLFDDLAEAAALTRAVDLVISAPTATSFLAAAVGVPTWMMTYGKPWQMMGTDAIPWFPAMRCFSRRWDQPWEDVIADIARALNSSTRASAHA